ncbi:unnamed protein product [Microthlaspi erraticum]|uniref:Reverse transcriptase Ty1/copia-type domain-containing protein n=1 Tax=Microthlaspi erraticum TaxID=1685480 RepID=A0A6D2I8H5_9BRAS|nr:unnamed protein product [Microthlaspi erraticum]
MFASVDIAGDNRDNVQGGATQTENQTQETPNEQLEEVVKQTEGQDLADYQLVRDRPRRQAKLPVRLEDYQLEDEFEDIAGYAYLITDDGGKPERGCYQEALNRRKDKKAIGCKWVFKRKAGIPGVEAPRLKARLVAKGYSDKEGIDYQEIFSPVVKHVSIRCMLSAVLHFDMELQQMDVKTAFLHGYLDEEIYMEQPEGYVDKNPPDKVCLLKRSLYGLKQSPRQWNTRFDEFMQSNDYQRSEYDVCIYYKEHKNGEFVYLLLYVDDILIASRDKKQVEDLKKLLSSEFEMKDLGEAKKILGMEITRDRSRGILTIFQEGYLTKVLGNFGMDQSKPTGIRLGAHFKLQAATEKESQDQRESMENFPYQSDVGSLMYAMIGTRPDLAYAVGMRKLVYKKEREFVIKGYCDSYYAADKDKRRSISGLLEHLEHMGREEHGRTWCMDAAQLDTQRKKEAILKTSSTTYSTNRSSSSTRPAKLQLDRAEKSKSNPKNVASPLTFL